MVTDIVELLKFWKSGEITQQLSDMFVKGNSAKFELSQALEDGSSSELHGETGIEVNGGNCRMFCFYKCNEARD